jgi:hypothetical protein
MLKEIREEIGKISNGGVQKVLKLIVDKMESAGAFDDGDCDTEDDEVRAEITEIVEDLENENDELRAEITDIVEDKESE